MLNVFFRAVITGFGFSLGKALYDEASKRLGVSNKGADPKPVVDEVAAGDDGDDDRQTDLLPPATA